MKRYGQQVQISGDSPFYGCTADNPASQPGELFYDSEVEPWVAVNPRYPNHVVASWQQDRWSNGGARGLVAGVSFDGGRHWLEVPLPGLTPCTGGGEFIRASDPWLTFDPNGDIYHIALLAGLSLIELIEGQSETGRSAMVVPKSTNDGGITWSKPVEINKTPTDIPAVNQQAFVPSVAANGRDVAITYYDFRFNGEEPGALTDYWAVTCRPRRHFSCARPGHWKKEIRLTNESFDLLEAPVAGGLFLGDYAGLSAAHNRFIAVFSMASLTDPANIFSRRFKRGHQRRRRR